MGLHPERQQHERADHPEQRVDRQDRGPLHRISPPPAARVVCGFLPHQRCAARRAASRAASITASGSAPRALQPPQRLGARRLALPRRRRRNPRRAAGRSRGLWHRPCAPSTTTSTPSRASRRRMVIASPSAGTMMSPSSTSRPLRTSASLPGLPGREAHDVAVLLDHLRAGMPLARRAAPVRPCGGSRRGPGRGFPDAASRRALPVRGGRDGRRRGSGSGGRSPSRSRAARSWFCTRPIAISLPGIWRLENSTTSPSVRLDRVLLLGHARERRARLALPAGGDDQHLAARQAHRRVEIDRLGEILRGSRWPVPTSMIRSSERPATHSCAPGLLGDVARASAAARRWRRRWSPPPACPHDARTSSSSPR